MKPNKGPKMLGFVPQTPLASSRETRPTQWLKRHLLQVGKPAQRSGSNATCFKSGNPPNAVAQTPLASSRETRPTQWLPNLHKFIFLA
ncbi:hypothetical protein [Nostoc sp. CHAB 5715]|uniref:hypothetical protein n=1 Tax=Nostoc sp. CHAB 5715 TaxID=2780400 RepID=UPI001E4A6A54|nr:hypothetical protein [Nostoc sp. CHAB 5715]MCC5621421.1 hypothetical protein [Nostoc sp. CHAB 5715]